MPDEIKTSDSGNQGTQNTGYSAEYVKTLRDEAAAWRTKLRETETEIQTLKQTIQKTQIDNTIGKELEKRGLKINPSWIQIEEGMAPDKAVDKFLKDYPQLAGSTGDIHASTEQNHTVPPNAGRKPMVPNSQNTNIENTAKSELSAIKKDPVAREKLRGLYRGLLAQNSGSSNFIH